MRSNGSVIGKVNTPTESLASGVWSMDEAFRALLSNAWPLPTTNYWGTGSDGDVTIATNTNLTSTLDGDMVVKNYQNLTINSGCTLTTSNRCKGLLIYVKGNLTVNGTITMTARGASVNPVSAGVASTGIRFIRRKSGSTETLSASDLSGCGSAATTAEANQLAISSNGKIYTISRVGASGGAAVSDAAGTLVTASQGGDGGTLQAGGGSSGAARYFSGPSGRGGNATCFSGGPGGGATNDASTTGVTAGSDNGGAGGNATSGSGAAGGGAGNPAGSGAGSPQAGTGGLLIIIVKGSITIGATGVISANGSVGGSAQASGGSSGGGIILMLRAGSYTNSGTVQANGGASPGSGGARAGNGSVVAEQIQL